MVGGRRSSERLEIGPSAAPLLDALTRRLGSLTDNLVVQPARAGSWTAFYAGSGAHLIALARPSPGGGPAALDIAAPAIDWAGTVTKAGDLDDGDVEPMLALAVRRAPGSEAESFAQLTSGFGDPISAIFAFIAMILGFLAWLLKSRQERAAAAATGRQQQLAILNAARRDILRRANSLTLGCLGAILVGFVSFFAIIWVAAWLVSRSPGLVPAAAALYLVPLALAVVVFVSIRRRYPSPPRGRVNPTQVLRNVLLFTGAVIALVLLAGIANR